MASEAAKTIDGVTRSITWVSFLVAMVGLMLVIGPGYLNPLRFGPYFIVVGMIGFFVPGVLSLVFGLMFQRERRAIFFGLTMIGLAWQLAVALGTFGAQFFFSPISAVPLLLCGLWAATAAILFFRLWRLHGSVGSDAAATRGFAINDVADADIPDAIQIDSDREK